MRILIILIGLSCITACANRSGDSFETANDFESVTSEQNNDVVVNLYSRETNNGLESVAPKQQVTSASENLIHQHITRLSNTLFSSAKNIKLNQSVAVGTFLPVSLLNEKNSLQQNHIGLQIQESFITLGAQAGLKIIEYKTMSSIKIQPSSDVMLSRKTQYLPEKITAEYFLTGTYSEQDNSLVVNARLIELSSQNVVAAATDYIPTVSLRSKQKITMKNNMLYRKSF